MAAEGNGQARRSLPKTLLPIVALSAVVVVLGALLLLKSVHGGDANQAPPDALAKARQALEARDFSGAAGDLAGFEPRNAHQAQEAEALRRAATREAAAHAKLQQAEQALSAGDLGQAKALLASVETELQVNQLNDLKHRAQASDTAPAAAPAAAPGATGASDAVQLLAQGKAQLRSGDFEQAASTLERCLQVDPLELHCEAYLGAAYIQLDDSSKGAEHYRKFVQNAPDDPTYHAEVAKVRQRLSSYEQALRKRGGGRR